MNLGEMYREVRERLAEDAENYWRDSQIYRAINQAIQRFSHEHRWKWLVVSCTFTVNQGDSEIELVDDVDYTRHHNLILVPTVDSDDRNLIKLEHVQPDRAGILRKEYATATNTEPRYYYLDHRVINTYSPSGYGESSDSARAIGISVRIIPDADEEYDGEFRYYRNVRLLDSSTLTDVPDVPIQYHDAIVALATGNLWLKELTGGTKAQEQFNVYNSILDQARKDETNNPDDSFIIWGGEEPRRVRGAIGEFSLDRWVTLPLG